VDWPTLFGNNRLAEVNRVTKKVEDATERATANGNRDWSACINNLNPTGKAVGGVHSYRADTVVTKVLLNFADKWLVAVTLNGDG
jgi:hypothetical protein